MRKYTLKLRSEGFTFKHKPLKEKYFPRSKYFANIEDHDRERVCPDIQWVTWSIELNPGQGEWNSLHSRQSLNHERVHLTVEKKSRYQVWGKPDVFQSNQKPNR